MATAALTTVAGLLKEVYGPRIVNQLRTKAIGWKRIQDSSDGVTEKVGGKYVDFPIMIGRNQGISYRNESEQIGRPGRSSSSEVNVRLKYGYVRGRVTGQLLELAEKNEQSFASGLDTEMKSMKQSVQRDQSRIFYGDGTGLLTTVDTDPGVANTSFIAKDTYWLEPLMDIDIRTVASGAAVANATDRQITSVVKSTRTVTVDGGLTFDAADGNTDGVYRQGNYLREPEGLKSIVANSGALYGLDPANVDLWRSNVDSTGGPISESAMIKMMDDIATDGGETTAIFTTLGVRRAYYNLLTQQRSFVNTKSFTGGLVGYSFEYGGNEVPVVADPDLREEGAMYFLNEDDFKFYHTGDWKFVDRDGSMFKWVDDYDEWQFMMRRYWQLGCSRRNSQGKMTGITEN